MMPDALRIVARARGGGPLARAPDDGDLVAQLAELGLAAERAARHIRIALAQLRLHLRSTQGGPPLKLSSAM